MQRVYFSIGLFIFLFLCSIFEALSLATNTLTMEGNSSIDTVKMYFLFILTSLSVIPVFFDPPRPKL